MIKIVLVNLLFACLSFSAEPEANDSGKKTLQSACTPCHSLRLVESQRLPAPAWGKEVDKMIGWGAIVADKQLLIDYLYSQYGDSKPVPPPAKSGDGSATTH